MCSKRLSETIAGVSEEKSNYIDIRNRPFQHIWKFT